MRFWCVFIVYVQNTQADASKDRDYLFQSEFIYIYILCMRAGKVHMCAGLFEPSLGQF